MVAFFFKCIYTKNMETLKAIKQRRSIRSFETTNVSRKIINDIVNTARFSPSAKNRQPWLFVVPNKKKKDEIANLMTFQLKSSKDGATEKKSIIIKAVLTELQI